MSPRILIIGALLCIGPRPGLAQPRVFPDDALDDVLLVQDILDAYLEEVDVFDPAELEARFGGRPGLPERAAAVFDRNRNGRFLDVADGAGLFDLEMAIRQFVHDPVDRDGDGVLGFYENECELVGGPSLDPDRAQTRAGVDDASVDCDGDGMSLAFELMHDLDPLRPDAGADPDDDGLDNRREAELGLNPRAADTDDDGVDDGAEVACGLDPARPEGGADADHDGRSDLLECREGTPLRPTLVARFEGDTVVVEHAPPAGAPRPELLELQLDFDAARLRFERARVGAAAQAAGKSVFAAEVAPGRLRVSWTALGLASIGPGALVHLDFAPRAAGEATVRFVTDAGQAVPAGVVTYGAGHPDAPLRRVVAP